MPKIVCSSSKMVPTGVPQGGVLSPFVFVLFVSDLHSKAPTYADDTTTGTSASTVEMTLKLMEEDAAQVLKFMAANGLVANPNMHQKIYSRKFTSLILGLSWGGREWGS